MTGFHAIVLAAGAGRRYGGGKLMADWRGRPLIQASVEGALAAFVDRVVVVLGCEADTVANALAPLAGPRLQIVVAEDWPEGIAAPLRAGVRSLPPQSRGALIFLGDMPAIPKALPPLVLAHLAGGAPAVQPFYHDAPGHPVGVSRTLYPDLLVLKGDRGAATLLRTTPDVVRVETDDAGAVWDIDRPSDMWKPAPTE